MHNKPNVLLITADSLRADFIGCFIDNTIKSITPNIDKFADHAFLFKNYFTQGNRTPVAFPSILSGQYAFRYGFGKKISEKRLLTQEILKYNKYTSLAIHSNPYISAEFNYNRGFDHYQENIKKFDRPLLNRKLRKLLRRIDIIINGPYSTGQKINKQFFATLKKMKNKHYFAWLHYMDTHGPYIKKNGLKQFNLLKGSMLWKKAMTAPIEITKSEHEELINTYQDEIRYFDECFQKIISNIDLEETIIIFTSDHGELLGEHGAYGHDHNHYEQLFKVPLIIRLPHKYFTYQPKVIYHMSQSIDLCPTILELIGIDDGYDFDGESLVHYMKNDTHAEKEKFIIHEIQKNYYCIRSSRFKYIHKNRSDEAFEILYDLQNDPDEQKDCLQQNINNHEVQKLIQTLMEYKSYLENDNTSIQNDLEVSENIQERLKALGYL